MKPRILVDSNVLLDIVCEDPLWAQWSDDALMTCAEFGRLVINQVIYAEVSTGYRSSAGADVAFSTDLIFRENLPWEAAFLAGKAFVEYRRSRGTRRSPLPDFYIGAHAQVGNMRLLTRDSARYRTYFPDVELITPED